MFSRIGFRRVARGIAQRLASHFPFSSSTHLASATAVCTLSLLTLSTPVLAATSSPAPTVIRIAAPDMSGGPLPFPGGGPVTIVYVEKQLEAAFQRDGIKVQWQLFKGAGPAINEAFANHQIDFAFLGDLAAIIGKAGGVDSRLIATTDHGANTYLATPTNSAIHTFADLKGKRIAVFRGTADQLALDRTLADHGLSERDLKIINLDWSASKAALVAGQIDGAWSGSGLLVLRDKGLAKIALSTKGGARADTIQAGLVVSQDFAQHYPAATQQVVNVLVAAAYWATQQQNRQALLTTLSHQSSLPVTVFDSEFDDDLKFRFSPRIDPFVASRFTASVADAHTARLIRQPFDVAHWIDNEFVDKALQQQKLSAYWPVFDAKGQAAP